MLPWLPFETTDGTVPLAEFARAHPVIHLARTVEEYRQVAPIATAQGLGVVNGGYTYDADLVGLLPQVLPGISGGGVLVFLTVMKELPATLILSPIGFDTLATDMVSGL